MATITYQLDPASNQTWKSGNINSAQGVSFEESGDILAYSSGGIKTIGALHIDNIQSGITITSSDTAQASGANYRIGQQGALVLKYIQAADGSGTTGTVKTVTYATTVLVGVSNEVNTAGMATLVLSFIAYNSSGNDPVVYS